MNLNTKKYTIEDGEHKNEVIVSWIITHTCQEQCAYCISPIKTLEITSEEEHFAIQNKMIMDGLKKNRYIGGEPLTIPHLPKLIADAFTKGVNTRLSTNGILLTQSKFNELKNFLNSIALPFETLNDNVNEKIRGIYGKKHREIISSRIKMIRDSNINIGLLINTCVHKENINELEELGDFLSKNNIDHWKLRLFNYKTGRGAVQNKNRFMISDLEFSDKVLQLQKMYPNLKIDGRKPSKLETRLMLSPQGNLYRMVGSDETHVHYGNLLKDNLNIGKIYERDRCN